MVKTRFYILFSILVLTIPQISTAALLHINDPSLPASSDGFNITRDTSTGLIGLIGLARHKQFV